MSQHFPRTSTEPTPEDLDEAATLLGDLIHHVETAANALPRTFDVSQTRHELLDMITSLKVRREKLLFNRKYVAARFVRKQAYESESPHALPTFRGYTVDLRLKEFRKPKMKRGEPAGIDFLRFDSVQGDIMLADWLRTPEGARASKEGKVEF